MTKKELQLTKGIHNLVRGKITWEESWDLLSEIMETKEWIDYWELETILFRYHNKN